VIKQGEGEGQGQTIHAIRSYFMSPCVTHTSGTVPQINTICFNNSHKIAAVTLESVSNTGTTHQLHVDQCLSTLLRILRSRDRVTARTPAIILKPFMGFLSRSRQIL